jgi:XTP/dITP diphosphohydrolase
MKIVLATKNPSKTKELRSLAKGLPIEIVSLDTFPAIKMPAEDGSTFRENAIKKARYAAERTGLAALADDSGLEVDALGRLPGIHSARYAGETATDEENNIKLLRELRGVPPEERTARFKCVIALVEGPGKEFTFEGTTEGLIGSAPEGTRGFGYDPLFVVPETGTTMAGLDPEGKNRISHRGRAMEKLRKWLLENAR